MTARSCLLALMFTGSVLALGPSASAQEAQFRLTPDDIAALARGGAGPGSSGVAGIQTTVLFGDPTAAGPYAIQIDVPPNTRIAAHRHRDARTAVVVSGAWYFGYGPVADESLVKALPPGSYYSEPAGVPHFALTRAEGAVVYIIGTGPTDTVFTATPDAP